LLAPVFCESIKEIVRLENSREVVDLDNMAKVVRVEGYVLVDGEVIVDVFDRDSFRLF